jgi:hypothetical protein
LWIECLTVEYQLRIELPGPPNCLAPREQSSG